MKWKTLEDVKKTLINISIVMQFNLFNKVLLVKFKKNKLSENKMKIIYISFKYYDLFLNTLYLPSSL